MNVNSAFAWFFSSLGAAVLFACSLTHADVRPITVTITVTDPDGAPIADVPLQSITKNGVSFGITNGDGQLVVVVDADESETVFVTRLWDGRWHDLPLDQGMLAERRVEELRHEFSFKPVYTLPLTPEQHEYTLSIATAPTVRVRGRLVDADGQPIVGGIGSRDRIAYDDVEEDDAGAFDFGGIERGAPVRLLAQRSTQVHVIEIPGAQTLLDVELGDVVVVDASADAPVRITMQNQAYLLDSTLASLSLSACFVSTDGVLVLGFPADLEGNVVREIPYVPPRLPLLPAGEYYVVPGHLGLQSGMALYLSVHAGRQALLDAAGVPKITAVSGEEAVLEFDARAVYQAVMQVGGDLVE